MPFNNSLPFDITLQVAYNGPSTSLRTSLDDRVRQTVGATTTSFILDSAGGLPEVISTTRGTTYLHLPGVIMAQNATGQRVYLLPDGLGSIRQVMSGTNVVAQRDFDPYGNPISTPSVSVPPYGFTGEWWEQDAQLLHLRARWYAPYLNQFISPDPIVPDYSKPQSLNLQIFRKIFWISETIFSRKDAKILLKFASL